MQYSNEPINIPYSFPPAPQPPATPPVAPAAYAASRHRVSAWRSVVLTLH
jgi:hypothetical protein